MKYIKAAGALAAGALLTLTGCTFGAGIDTLMTPPKLSAQQEQIYSALTDAAGSSISLKYPKSGKYLSAFIVEDIDGDGGSEAVVFYEKNSLAVEENTLRINILDREDDKWRSVYDFPAEGAEIERVMISRLGSNDRVNLIIGSSQINRSEKNVSIYNYSSGEFERTFSESYSFFDVTDLDGSGENEFLLLTGASAGGSAEVKAYKLDSEGMYHQYVCQLSGGFTEFDSMTYGSLSDGVSGLYIDAVSGAGYIQTDVVYMDGGGLKKVFASPEASYSTLRPSGCSSSDVDGDGIPEIPVQVIAPGYEDSPESEQLRLTSWLRVSSGGRLDRRYSSYYSISEGYIFIFPEKWHSSVSVRRDTINDEIVFCVYNSSTGETGRELMRIYCAEDSASREDRISMGYMLLRTKGDSSYLAYIPQYTGPYDDDLSITAADAAIGFKYIQ
ncbi:MAG: hypothetical protein IJ874_10030 [Ruminococcus sp.]|nr:hypothetical protein [Ruminococcus sp.]